MSDDAIASLLKEDPPLRPARRRSPSARASARARRTTASTGRASTTRTRSGRGRPRTWCSARRGRRPSSGSCPHAKWFVGATLNVTESCLDRHLATPRRNKAAIVWEGEPGDDAHAHLRRAPRARSCASPTRSRELGVEKGDRVAIYMGMVPEVGRRDARVRAHRRGALGHLRRLRGRRAPRPHQRLPGARSSSRRTAAGAAAASCRSRRRSTRRSSSRRPRASRRCVVFERLGHERAPRRR